MQKLALYSSALVLVIGFVLSAVFVADYVIGKRVLEHYFDSEKVLLQDFADKARAMNGISFKEFALTNYCQFLEAYGDIAFKQKTDLQYELFLTHSRLYHLHTRLTNAPEAEKHFLTASNHLWLLKSKALTKEFLATNAVFHIEM